MNSPTQNKRKTKHIVAEMCIYSMLAAMMYASKILMDALPNIHLLGMFVMAFTLVFRKRALIPLYLFVLMIGLINGFNLWWVPYLYLWAILWGITMLLPRKLPTKWKAILYPIVCALFGLAYGTLYAPFQAFAFHLSWKGMIAWIIAGLPFDGLHALGNLCAGVLIVPLAKLLASLCKEVMPIASEWKTPAKQLATEPTPESETAPESTK